MDANHRKWTAKPIRPRTTATATNPSCSACRPLSPPVAALAPAVDSSTSAATAWTATGGAVFLTVRRRGVAAGLPVSALRLLRGETASLDLVGAGIGSYLSDGEMERAPCPRPRTDGYPKLVGVQTTAASGLIRVKALVPGYRSWVTRCRYRTGP